MALNKLTADALVDGTLDADAIGTASITTAKLHSNIISGQTAIGTVDASNDLLLIYDNDATSLKKVPVSSVGATNTDSITEGSSNLYYTNARADARAQLKIDALVDSAPGTLDTLNELAAALGDDANFSTTVTNSIATKMPLAGGTMTGDIAHASDFTIDVGGDITLDADGGDIILKDGGTEYGKLSQVLGGLTIKSGPSSTPAIVMDGSGNVIGGGNYTTSGVGSFSKVVATTGSVGSQFYAGEFSRSSSSITTPDIWGTNGTLVIGSDASTEAIGISGANSYFYGNVGIGISSPGTKLQVAGTQNTPSGTSKGMLLVRADGSTHGLQMGVSGSAPWGSWIQAQDNNISSPYPLTLQPGGGDVGIGTTSPTAKLHIQRAVYGGYNALLLENTNANAGVLNFVDLQMLAGGSTGKVILRMENSSASGATDGELAIHTTSGGTTTERMRIDNNGNVGIGTNNPSTLLDVRGKVSVAYDSGNHALRLYNQPRNNWSSLSNMQTGNQADLVFKSGTGSMTFTHSGDLQLGDIQETTGGGNISLTKTSSSSIISIMSRSATDGHTGMLNFYKTPATSGNYTSTTSGDVLGEIRFYGVNNSAVADIGAMIQVSQTGAFNNSVPAKMTFTTQETQRISIHADGHIGIGDNVTVSSAWSTVFGARVQMDTKGVLAATDGSMQIGHNWYYDGGGTTGYKYIASGKANRQIHVDDYISWEMEETAGTAGAEITFTERMRLTKDGNLGINVGSNNPSDRLVVVAGGTGILVARNWSGNVTSGSGLGEIGFKGYASGNSTLASDAKITGVADGAHSGTSAPARLEFYVKHPTTGPGSAPTRRMQLSSYGELLLEDGATGWASFYMNESAGIRYHVRRYYANASTVTSNVLRVKRHYWGVGFYKLTAKQQYYSTISEQEFYLTGHGRNDGSYNASYALSYQNVYNGTSSRMQITTPSASAPGNSAAAYVDVQIVVPAYHHYVVVIEAGGMAGFSHDVSSMSGNDMYALHG